MPGILSSWANTRLLGLLKSSHWKLLRNDFIKAKIQTKSLDWHIEQSVKWVLVSWEATNFLGLSTGYSLLFGWESKVSGYSGYIIPSLWKFYHISENQALKDKVKKCAISLADWEIDIQLESGAIQVAGKQGYFFFRNSERSKVLDTAMSIYGWVAIYKEIKDDKYLNALVKAANWLVSIQDPVGLWIFESSDKSISDSNAKSSLIAHALSEAFLVVNNKEFEISSRKCLDAIINRQESYGFFEGTFLKKNQSTFLSNLATTIQTMLEVGVHLNEKKYIDSSEKAAFALFELFKSDNTFWGSYSDSLIPDKSFKNLSGMVQMAIVYYKVYLVSHKQEYASAFASLNRQVQELTIVSKDSALNGGIRGSFPIWGRYCRMSFPISASKYYLDALFFEKEMCGC